MRSAGPRQLSVLVSGGGIPGPTLACQLARAGHRTTVDFRDEDGESACSSPPHAVAAVGIEEVPAEVLSQTRGRSCTGCKAWARQPLQRGVTAALSAAWRSK